jgi:hypothetical protein
MNRLAASLAVAAALALAPALVSAADPAGANPTGDWIGTMHLSKLDIFAGLEIRRTEKGYEGVYDAISQGYWGVPLTRARPAAPLTFQVTNLSGTLSFTWDPAGQRWTGDWREKGGVWPFTLKRGPIPPAPLVTGRNGIGLALLGGVALLEAAGIARLLYLRRRRRMRLRST